MLETTDDDLERNWTKWCYALCSVPVTVGDALPERAREALFDRPVESWVTFGTAPDDATVVDADARLGHRSGVVCLYVCGAVVRARRARQEPGRILRPQPRRQVGSAVHRRFAKPRASLRRRRSFDRHAGVTASQRATQLASHDVSTHAVTLRGAESVRVVPEGTRATLHQLAVHAVVSRTCVA